MPRPKRVKSELARRAEAALNEINNYKICIRLQAIVSCMSHPIENVASVMGVERTSLWRWIKKFEIEGVQGLYDRPKGHRQPKLNESQKSLINKWLIEGIDNAGKPIHWTLEKLSVHIEKDLNVKISTTALWTMMHNSGFKLKVPRPSHAKSNKEAQEGFKKNC